MVDMNIDNLMKKCIFEVIEAHRNGELSSCETIWYSLTRRMFQRYNAMTIYELVFRALEEASDELWFENKYPVEVFKEMDCNIPKQRKKRNPVSGAGITAKITKEISIINIAEQFGIKVRGDKAICPFHNDHNPSLSLDDNKGLFYCHGCHVGGNIIKFYAMLKELKPDFVYHKQESKCNAHTAEN